MFGWRKQSRQKNTLPDISSEMIDIIKTTLGICSRQIEQCFGSGVRTVPRISQFHDVLVGCYSYGFLQGEFLISHADIAWAKGDKMKAHLGFMACYIAVMAALMDHERALHASSFVNSLHADDACEEEKWIAVDRAGGTDGMAIAAGKPLPTGGYLLSLLSQNVTEEERAMVRSRT